ncbi:hypothetical protein NQ317_005435 [Molorchus minor]|uniref:Uncharacterized protein n=1 Tax=Molorchus minor TaxID=1323400 RepID=A0ABQ9JJ48_9CUCU|nr:hypothetical protein NQ317_005435 [Molorchus minor]
MFVWCGSLLGLDYPSGQPWSNPFSLTNEKSSQINRNSTVPLKVDSLIPIQNEVPFLWEADCPDWVLVEINTLSRLSSVKLKILGQVVAQGILNPPKKAEKLFSESKLDPDIDLKACIACLTFIITSTVRFNCDSSALQSELQQLGLPREHSTCIKRITDEHSSSLTAKLSASSLKVNPLEDFSARVDQSINCAILDLVIGNEKNLLPSHHIL